MGADFDLSINQNGQPQIMFIDKGKKNVNVGNKLSDFIIERQLGKGHFGSVYLVTSKLTKKVYAMKEIKSERYKNEHQKLEIQKEIKLLENLDHPHVITYFSSFNENGNFYIIIEYINGGSLKDLIKIAKEKGKLIDEKKIWDFLIQILSGLVYLHDHKKIIHRDIKPDNILFDKEGNLKISDFGISAVNKEDVDDLIKCHGTRIGPVQFMAPEMINNGAYEFKSDIYMLGSTFFNLMSGQLPEKKTVQNNNILVTLNENTTIPDYYSGDIKDFIKKLMNVNKNERPSAKIAFIEAISFFTIKYLRITSILSVLQCFYIIPNMISFFLSDRIEEYIKGDDASKKYSTVRAVKKVFNNINPYALEYDNARIYCLKLRLLFCPKEEDLRKINEIDIVTAIEDICNHLHRELNRNKLNSNQSMPGRNTIIEEYFDNNNTSEEIIDESDEVKVLESACKRLQENYRSKISELLYFIVKTTYQCPECDNNIKFTTTVHCAYCLRPERASFRLKKTKITVNDLFLHSTMKRIFDDLNLYCNICNKNQNSVKVFKMFYTCPLNLILAMDYSKEDNFILQIEEYIDISNYVERKDISKTKYRLIGAIFNEKKDDIVKYISYTKDIIDGQWKYFNGKTYENSNLNELQNHKGIKALFYTIV